MSPQSQTPDIHKDMDKFINGSALEIHETITRLKSLMNQAVTKLNEIDAIRENIQIELASAKHDSQSASQLNIEAIKIREDAKTYLQNAKETESKSEKILESAITQNKKIDERLKSLDKERDSTIVRESEVKKKEKWIEIEETRLKYLEHRLNAISEHENIKKKLKELE